jgi:hypothetical protein
MPGVVPICAPGFTPDCAFVAVPGRVVVFVLEFAPAVVPVVPLPLCPAVLPLWPAFPVVGCWPDMIEPLTMPKATIVILMRRV